jgi:hypothetical protein
MVAKSISSDPCVVQGTKHLLHLVVGDYNCQSMQTNTIWADTCCVCTGDQTWVSCIHLFWMNRASRAGSCTPTPATLPNVPLGYFSAIPCMIYLNCNYIISWICNWAQQDSRNTLPLPGWCQDRIKCLVYDQIPFHCIWDLNSLIVLGRVYVTGQDPWTGRIAK